MIGICIAVEDSGATSGHSQKGEFTRFLGIPSAGNRLSPSVLFHLNIFIILFSNCLHVIVYQALVFFKAAKLFSFLMLYHHKKFSRLNIILM